MSPYALDLHERCIGVSMVFSKRINLALFALFYFIHLHTQFICSFC